MASNYIQSARVSRRALMGAGLASAAVVPLTSLHRASAGSVPQAMSVTAAIQEASADPATWRTWLLASADELRPAAPGMPRSRLRPGAPGPTSRRGRREHVRAPDA